MGSKMDFTAILPDEILVEIFVYLDQDSRTNAEFVCTRWHKILSEDIKFAKYHQLILDNCVLRMDLAPVSEFMERERKIGYLSISQTVRYSGDLTPFWERLGRTLVSLEVQEFNPYTMRSYFLADIIGRFKRLQKLHFGTYFMDRGMLRTSTGTYTARWPSVKHLTIDQLKIDSENYGFFHEMMPNMKTLEIGMYQGCDEEFIKKYLPIIRRLGLSWRHFSMAMLVRVTDNPEFSVNEIACCVDSGGYLSQIAEIVASHECIKRLELSMTVFPRIPIKNLKKLRIELNESISSFDLLGQYQQLETLEIKLCNYESKCYFGHQIISVDSLKHFSIYSFVSGHCATCHQFMFQSFPNLKSFTLESCFVTSVDTLQLISKHLSTIERLTLRYFAAQSLKMDGILQEWTKMPTLKYLELKACGNVTKSAINNLCKRCPSLEFISFSGATNFEQKFLELMVNKLKRIRCIKIEQGKQPHEKLKMNATYTVELDSKGRRLHCYKI